MIAFETLDGDRSQGRQAELIRIVRQLRALT